MLANKKSLYTQAVDISNEFLGPAGERFIRRQITTHIGIAPEDLQGRDIDTLIDWSKPALALLTDNLRYVEMFTDKLYALKKTNAKKAKVNYANRKQST